MRIKKLIGIVLSLSLVTSALAGCTSQETQSAQSTNNALGSATTQTETSMAYESELFGEEPMTVNVIVNDDDWKSLLDSASDKEYISVDMEVNGTLFSDVGIRTKGNSSLNMVASNSDSDRYSFKVKFDKYEDDQTCFGLDKLVLNNIVSDNTYLKDYLSFELMNEIGVPSSLYNFAVISVNGEYWGMYLALEGYSNSFCERVYGNDDGNLYNVKMVNGIGDEKDKMPQQGGEATSDNETAMPENNSSSMSENNAPPSGGFNSSLPDGFNLDDYIEKSAQEGFNLTQYLQDLGLTEADFNIPENKEMDLEDVLDMMTAIKSGDFAWQNMPQGGGMGGGMGASSTGGTLVYTEDEISSYPSIFENAVFNHTTEEDNQKVLEAIKALNNGENIDTYFNVDEILRYLAAHTILCNYDSYSSSMAQNYYIYESEGVLSILPWDYNLAFGGFQAQDATSVVNWAIDTPVYGVEMEDRPLINQLLSNEEYLAKYHEYLQEMVDGYLSDISSRIDTIISKIDSYVETDPTAFISYDEFQKAVDTLKTFMKLRTESIKGQLDGRIPATTQEQNNDTTALIDASSITLSDMGTQGGDENKGGEGRDGQNAMPEKPSDKN